MKISRIFTRIMSVSRPSDEAPRRNWVFAFVETDAGITGVGEATVDWHEWAVSRMIEDHMGPMLVGKDPTRVESNWISLHRGFFWRDGIVASAAISALDMAQWDITGKAYNLPVYKLLGGAVRDRVRVYARGDLGLSDQVEEASAAVDEGFDAFKVRVLGVLTPQFDEEMQVDRTVEVTKAIRQRVGPTVDLMVDLVGNLSLQAATRFLQEVRGVRLLFVEEPVTVDNLSTLVDLRRANPHVRIAAGERLLSRWAFRDVFEKGAVDVAQPDTAYAGGISEVRRIAQYAEVHGIRMALHNSCGPVATAAASHAAAAMGNFLILEYCRLRPWFDRVQRFGPTVQAGSIELTDRPGLGIELDLDVIDQYPYRPLPLAARQVGYRDRWGAHALI